MLPSGYVLGGKYEIQQEVGRGGMSIVYLAMDRRLNKVWAVKEVKASGKDQNGEIFAAQFIQEAEMLMHLDHPALPRIVDLIDENDKKYVVMDFVEGQNLFEVIKERGSFEEEEVIEWAKQITDALGYLHRQDPPIIYRDMKPGNVMLKPDGNIKIIDFGIARRYKVGNLTDTVALGTQGYVPPEQYSGQTDQRSDIFAIGMTMHHLLTGVDPRTADAYAPVRNWKPNLSEGIELIVNKCTAPAPEKRYQNCDELLYDLSHPDQITKDYRKKQKSKLRTFFITALAGVIFLGGGIGMQVGANMMDQADYDNLVGDMEGNSANEFSKLVDLATAARNLQPQNPEPVQLVVNNLWTRPDTTHMQTEMLSLNTLYNNPSFSVEPAAHPEELMRLNLDIAQLYLTNYDNKDKTATNEDRFQKAFGFLQNNHKMTNAPEGNEKAISEDYYDILNYYVNRIMTASLSAPLAGDKSGKEKINENFFTTADKVVNNMGDTEKLYGTDEVGTSNRLLLYKAISNCLTVSYEKKGVSEQEKERIRGLAESIYEQVDVDVKDGTVTVGDGVTQSADLYTKTAEDLIETLQSTFKFSKKEAN